MELAVQAFALWSFACSSASGPSGLPVVPGEGGQASEGSDAAEAQSPPTTDGLAPIDVEAGDAGGAVDATAPPPSVDGLAPSEVTLGGTVTVVGTDFLPDPRVQLNGVLIVPSQVSATQMTIVVPADLPLSSCTESVSLLVQNDFGAAPPAVLQVDRPAPRIDAPGGVSVRAGGALSLTGAGLAGAMGALDGVGLATRASSPAAIVLNVPRATSPGHHALAVSGCGEADLDVLVLAPAPLILSADRTTIAANGVVRVTADVSNGARIDTVQVGTEPISTTDASSFQWQSQSYPTQAVFAVRMPSDLTPGSVNLRLGGAGAESDPYAIAVIAASPRSPPASSGIVFPPLKAADDPFPIGSKEPYPEQDLQGPTSPSFWVYTLDFYDDKTGGACSGGGSVSGAEKHCPVPFAQPDGGGQVCALSNVMRQPDGSFPCDGDICNAITGRYHLDLTTNQVTLSIDRLAPEGPEPYEGGWVQADGSPPASTSPFNTFLMLRSLWTGIELTVHHELGSGSYPACNP